MVNTRRYPCVGRVAAIARQRGNNVRRAFALFREFAAAVVTDRAGRGRLDLGVIKGLGRRKARWRHVVTFIAGVSCA